MNDLNYLFNNEHIDACTFENVKLPKGAGVNDKHFSDIIFTRCDFSGCDMKGNLFRDCVFVNCNLSLAKFADTEFYGVVFRDCQLSGIDWTASKLSRRTDKKKSKFPVAFERCVLNYSIFVMLNMYCASFVDCVIKEGCFEDANLEMSKFVNTDLMRSTFGNTNLEKADLSSARNYSINACVNNLKKAKFSFPEASTLVYALGVEIIS